MPLGFGLSLNPRRAAALANDAFNWYFAQFGLAGTPWADVSRTGLGTRVDSAGLVQFGPHNLLRASEDFSVTTSAWNYTSNATGTGTTVNFTGSGYFGQFFGHTAVLQTVVCEVRSGTKTGTIRLKDFNSAAQSSVITLTSEWQEISYTLTPSAAVYPALTNRVADGCDGLTGTVQVRRFRVCLLPGSTEYVSTGAGTAARYLPRITHDPVTLSALGLLVEGQGPNLQGMTEAFDGSAWTREGVSVLQNAAVGTDGTPTADLIAETTANSLHRILGGAFLVTGGVTYTISVYAKSAGRRFLNINANAQYGARSTFDLQSGVVASTFSGSARIVALPNGWYRCSVTGVAPASSSGTFYLQINNSSSSGDTAFAGDGVSGFVLEKAQVEASSIATSYIPNPGTGSALRAADWTGPGVALTGAALAAAFPAGFGQNTIVFSFAKTGTRFETLLALSAGTDYGPGNGLLIRDSGGSSVSVGGNSGSVSQGGLTLDGVTFNRVAVSWSGTNLQLSVNGQAPVSLGTLDFTGSGTTSLILGALTTGGLQPIASAIFGHIRVLPGQYITGAALQALTA